MDSKIKVIGLAALLLLCVFTGCKKEDWMDWKVQNELVLNANRHNHGVVTTETGVQYRVIYEGNKTEPRPHAESLVTCKYELRLPAANNRVIDQSEQATLPMVSVVPGFLEGLKHVHNHGIVEMWVPYEQGYGEDGYGSEGYQTHIPPYSTLYFKVVLSSVINAY